MKKLMEYQKAIRMEKSLAAASLEKAQQKEAVSYHGQILEEDENVDDDDDKVNNCSSQVVLSIVNVIFIYD
jgi:hypothetical protein